MQPYSTKSGQSVLDICLQTYGSLDYLSKLMVDSGHPDVNTAPFPGQVFSYDPDLLQDQVIGGSKASTLATLLNPAKTDKSSQQSITLITKIYSTDASRIILPGPIQNQMYQTADTDSFTSGSDGLTTVSLPAWIGWDVLQAELNILPLKKTQWAWNKSSGQFTLQGGLTVDKDQTLFFIFKKLTT